MASNREEFEYDLDASGLINEYRRIGEVIEYVNGVTEEEAAAIGRVERALNLSYEQKRKLINQEEALAYARQFSVEKMEQEYLLMRKLQDEYSASLSLMAELNRAKEKANTIAAQSAQQGAMDEAVALEKERIAALEAQANLTRELSAAQTKLNQTRQQETMDAAIASENERISTLEAQASLTRELSAAQTRLNQTRQQEAMDEAVALEKERIAALEAQANLTRELSAAQTKLNQTRQQETMDAAIASENERISTLEAQASLTRELSAAQTRLNQTRQQEAMDEAIASENERIATLEAQAAMTRELSAAQTKLNQTRQQEAMDNAVAAEKERLSQLEAQAALTKELSAAYTKSIQEKQRQTLETLKEAAAERELEQNRRRAAAAARLINQTIPVQSGTGANQLGRMLELIQRGDVAARRVVQIAREVAASAQIAYTGTERTVANAARSMIRENDRIAAAAQRAADRTNRSTHTMFLSWQSLGRLLIIQNIHLAVYKLINALNESIDAAAKFQIKISEIRTISQDSNLSFKEWSASVRQLSDAFGAPINQVAEGLYETISNQIANGAEAATFMAKAMSFARTTVSSTEDAVNLLSSALNSYGLAAQDTDRVAAILFKTIDLGRVRASEMANTFGRVAGLAAPLGVSLEEVSAAISTLTINGVKYNEAYTLINNILLKLLRPTKDMKELLESWGFSSGQAAIDGLTFVGVLQKLESASLTSADEIGDLFNQIRGIRGTLGLTGSAFKTFTKDLEEIKTNAGSEYFGAQAIAIESAGKKFEIEMNKIKNFFISDFGEPFIRGLIWLTESGDKASGTLSTLADKFRTLAIWFPRVTAAILIYKASTLTASSATLAYVRSVGVAQAASQGFSRSLSFIRANLGSIGWGSAIAGITYFMIKLEEAKANLALLEETTTSRIAEALEKQTAEFRKQLDKQAEDMKQSYSQRYRNAADYASKVRQLFTNEARAQEKITKETAETVRNTFDLMTKSFTEAVNKIQNLADKALENARRAREIMDSELPDANRFEKQLDQLPEDKQVAARIQRITELRRQLQDVINRAKGKTPEESAKDLALAAKLEKDIQSQITALIDKRGDAMARIKELQEQINEAETRGDAQAKIAEATARIREIEALKSRTSSEVKELRLLQQQLRQAEQARRAENNVDKLQQELDAWQSVLKILGQEGSEQQRINDFAKERNQLFDDYAKAQEALAATLKQQAEAEQKKLEVLRDVARQASAFKLDLGAGTSANDFQRSSSGQLADFDKLIQSAIQNGATKETITDLTKQAAALQRQADIELNKRKYQDTTERIAKEKDAALKIIDETAAKQKTLDETKKKVFLELNDEVKKILTAMDTGFINFFLNRQGFGRKGPQKAASEFLGLELKALEDTFNNPSISNAQREKSLRVWASEIRENLQKAKEAGGLGTIKEGDILGAGEVSVNDILNRVYALTERIITLPKEQTDAKTMAQVQEKILKDLAKQEDELRKQAKGSGVSPEQVYIETLETTTEKLKTFGQTVYDISRRLLGLPGQQISFNTSNLTPNTQIRVPSISNSGGVNVGDIYVTVSSSGNAQVDGRAIAKALNREIRLRTVSLDTENA